MWSFQAGAGSHQGRVSAPGVWAVFLQVLTMLRPQDVDLQRLTVTGLSIGADGACAAPSTTSDHLEFVLVCLWYFKDFV